MTPAQLKERRNALGISQKAAAAALGVAYRTYQNWEMGTAKRLPPLLDAALERLEGTPPAPVAQRQERSPVTAEVAGSTPAGRAKAAKPKTVPIIQARGGAIGILTPTVGKRFAGVDALTGEAIYR